MISFLCFYIGLFFTPVTWFFRPVFSFINLLLFAFSVCRISFISDSFMLSFLMLYINPVILSGMAIITAVFLLNPSQRRCHLCFVHHAATRSILQKSFASTAAVLLTLLQLNRNRLLHMNSSLLPMLTRTFHNNRQIICRYLFLLHSLHSQRIILYREASLLIMLRSQSISLTAVLCR